MNFEVALLIICCFLLVLTPFVVVFFKRRHDRLRREKKERRFEYVGPDVPRIQIVARITSYRACSDGIQMHIALGAEGQFSSDYVMTVPKEIPLHYPLGTPILLTLGKR